MSDTTAPATGTTLIFVDTQTGTWGDPSGLRLTTVTEDQHQDMCEGNLTDGDINDLGEIAGHPLAFYTALWAGGYNTPSQFGSVNPDAVKATVKSWVDMGIPQDHWVIVNRWDLLTGAVTDVSDEFGAPAPTED